MKRIAIVVAEFNGSITKSLLQGALEALNKKGITDVPVTFVPGAFELPLIAKKYAATKQYNAVICLGALIRGDTPHFDYISQACSYGIMQASLDTNIPIIFGVLTTDTVEQALERSTGPNHKGHEVATAAIQMAEHFN